MLQSVTQSQLLPILLAVAAFLVATLLILYIIRLLFGRRIRAPGARNRPRRLDVVDTFDLDRERQLVIVRRDNIEHLLLIGGPNDLLVEGAINRGEAAVTRIEPRETRPAVPAPGWPPAPAPAPSEAAAMAPPAREAAPALAPASPAPFSLDSLKRRAPEAPRAPEPPKAPPPAPTLPPDLFAPASADRPKPPPAAEPPAPQSPAASIGSAPRMGGPIFTPRPPASRPPTPPFLSRAQKVAPPPFKKDLGQPPAPPSQEPPPSVADAPPKQGVEPSPEPRIEEARREPITPPEPPPSERPREEAPAAEPSDALESLEAEMARLLGRPEH